MNREEEKLVAEFADELKFLFDEGRDIRRHAFGPPGLGAGFGQCAKVSGRGESLRYQLARVFVAEFVQGEGAAFGNRDGLIEHLLRIDRG